MDGKTQEEIGATPILLQSSCYDKELLLKLNQEEQLQHFVCLICKQIVNNPVDLTCSQHGNLNEALVAGENCLKTYLRDNNHCPVEPHENCQYSKNRALQKLLDELVVMCPRQFQASKQISQKDNGQPFIIAYYCHFKGKVKDLSNHLENTCPLKLVDCWFGPFGCNHVCVKHELKDHLTANLQFHFSLVMKTFESMQKIIQSYQ
ncbi:hypothetical protein RFI_12443, partial [Reticulomyxa filosa]